jgi:hypothetical protein
VVTLLLAWHGMARRRRRRRRRHRDCVKGMSNATAMLSPKELQTDDNDDRESPVIVCLMVKFLIKPFFVRSTLLETILTERRSSKKIPRRILETESSNSLGNNLLALVIGRYSKKHKLTF